MPSALGAVAEPARREILELLLAGPQSVGTIVAAIGLSQPGVSKHLRVLREAGLVHCRAHRQQRLYELRPEPLAEIDDWLAAFRPAWSQPAVALQRHLERRD